MNTDAVREGAFARLLEKMGEREGRAVLAAAGTAEALLAFDRWAAIQNAGTLLEGGMSARDVAYQLAGRYGVSYKTARRRVLEALDTGPR